MPIKIVTDSTCDLPPSVISEYDITVIPCYINMDGKSYLDGVDLSRQQFYERLPGCTTPATTSAPGLGTFAQVYKKLADEGASEILSIHIAASLSNVANVANLVAQESNDVPVTVVDGGQLTLGTGLLVIEAAKAALAGLNASKIAAFLKEQTRRTYTFAMVDTLEYLRRSGRVSGLVSGLGYLLQIKPLLKMHDSLYTLERVRTRARAMQRLIKLVSELGPLSHLSVVHTNALEQARALHQMAENLFPPKEVSYYTEVTPTIGVHIGPGAVGFVCTAVP